MTIEFKIAQLERQTSDGFVTTVHWTASKTEGEHTVSSYGSVGFTKEADMNLIPVDKLTEAMVIDWVKGSLDVSAMENSFDAQLKELANPKAIAELPWAKND
jgi:hypothetical protein